MTGSTPPVKNKSDLFVILFAIVVVVAILVIVWYCISCKEKPTTEEFLNQHRRKVETQARARAKAAQTRARQTAARQ